MTALKTAHLTRFLADQIIESVSETSASVLYLSVGKVEEWANDSVADTPVHTQDEFLGIWNNMQFAKKITGNDMSLIVRRINWTANTVYSPYNHYTDMRDLDYYVLTSDYNVYKCLDNNQGANSTVEPTYTRTSSTNRTADGYLWKFMYKLSSAQRLRFLTDEYMPVSVLTIDNGSPQYDVQDSAVEGAIESIHVTNGGVGFSSNITMTVTIGGDGAGAYANGISNTTSNTVEFIAVTSKGSGYTWANVTITSSNTDVANGATANIIISPFPGGHGSNPADELTVKGVLINVRLKGTEGDLVKVDNDFRQVALIRDPVLRNNVNAIGSNTIYNQTMSVTLSGAGGDYADDEWVYQGSNLAAATFKGRVVWYDSNMIELANTSGTIRSATLTGQTSSARHYVADYTFFPLKKHSGNILYIDNRVPITRSNVQTEHILIPIIC